jgi:hypothetical protein
MMKEKKGKTIYEDAVQSYDSQQSRDETTPRIRPWNANIKSNYGQRDDDELFHDERQRPELSLPSSDYGDGDDDFEEQYKNSMSSNDTNPEDGANLQLPMTPSRLLTISSTDFLDQYSSSAEQPQQQKNSKEQITQNIYPQSRGHVTQSSTEQQQREQPTYPYDITGEVDIDAEVKYHDDLIVDSMNRLNLTAQTHFQTILEKLVSKYSNIIQAKDDFIHEQLVAHKQTITDLQTLITNYEHKLEIQSYQTEKMKLSLMSFYQNRHTLHISSHSLRRVLSEWRLVVLRNRIYPHLHRQANQFHRKHLLSHSFQCIYRFSLHSKYQRKLQIQNSKSQQMMTEIISKYETEMSLLQLELKNSYELLQQEKYQKLHLEENLRRLFLKNMTVMNMNALSLFHDPASGDIPEPLWMTATDELVTVTPINANPMRHHQHIAPASTAEAVRTNKKKELDMEMLRNQREQLEHEQYLLEQRNLRNEMRIQQDELVKQQQGQGQGMSTGTRGGGVSEGGTPGAGGGGEVSGRRSEQIQMEQRAVKRQGQGSGQVKTKSVVKKSSHSSSTSTSRSSSSPNLFTISGPSYHSKRLNASNESTPSSATATQRHFSQTSSSVTTKMTQHSSTVVSSSSRGVTTTSRLDEKLFNTSSRHITPSQLLPQPMPLPPPPVPVSHPSRAPTSAAADSEEEDNEEEDIPPQPRRGGPQAIR